MMYFPFLTKTFGLDISDYSLELLALKQVSKKTGQAQVASWSRIEIPAGLVEDGMIKDKKGLVEQILKAKKQAQPLLTTAYCLISLPESKVFTHLFKLPKELTKQQIGEAISYEAQDLIPFASEELSADFLILRQLPSSQEQEVFYVASPKAVINSFQETLTAAGLKPLVFDLESLSTERVLVKNYSGQEVVLIADIGARTTNLNIFDQTGIKLSFTINRAGKKFTRAIATELNLSEGQANSEKEKIGLSDFKKPVGQVLQKEMDKLIKEVKEVLDYYTRQNPQKVSKILLIGGSALLPKISEYWQSKLDLSVVVAKPWLKVDLPDLKGKESLFVNVLGLAWRGLTPWPFSQGLNLLKYK